MIQERIDKFGLKDKTVCVIDTGNFISVAQRLSDFFGRVIYYIPSVLNGFPTHQAVDIGRGVNGIVRVQEWESYKREIDIFVFCDAFFGDLQEMLVSEGFPVFGSRKFGDLERDRLGFKNLLKELELPVGNYDVAIGAYELEEKLKFYEDRWVKSNIRGSMETWHHKNYILSKQLLKEMKHDLGVYDRQETYIIEEPIEAIAEIGADTICINGKYLEESLAGIEVKDCGFISRMTRYDDLPKQVTESLDKLVPIFQNGNYCGSISTEVRVDKDKVGYFTDLTARQPEPPTSLMLEMYENFGEIVWQVANGIVPKVEYKYMWGVEFIMKSEMAHKLPIAIQFPEEYKNFVKIKNLVIDNEGTRWYVPNGVEMSEVGAVVACANSMEDAINLGKTIADSIKGFDIKINTDCLEDAKRQIKELNKNGIRFL